MVHIPQSTTNALMKRECVEKTDRRKQMESIRHTVESTIKNALARKKMNGQPFAFSVDSNGNVHEIQSLAPTKEPQAGGSSMQDLNTTMDQAEDFADDELFGQPMTRAKGKRISRANRDRGRSTVRRDTTSKSAYIYPQPTAVSTPGSDAEPRIPTPKQHKTFMVQDEQAVKHFLHSRLKGMQQLADKKIAKAWIKSICPKKQANFPYQNKKHARDGQVNEQPPVVPGWWPERNVCRFIEPDHIKRTERMELCLHLLRLRPDPDQLKVWNKDKTEPNSTHLYHGWTAFLRESAGAEIFDELPKEDKVRTEQRKNMMEQMYRVAQLEQDFLDGAIDGDTQYSYEEDEEEKKTASVKRTRTMSVDSCAEGQSRQSSASVSCTRAKRARQTTPSKTSAMAPNQVQAQNVESNVPGSRPQENTQVEEQSDEGSFDFSQADTEYDSAMVDHFCISEAESQPGRSNPFISHHEVNLKCESRLERHHRFRPQPQQHQQQWVKYEQEPMPSTVSSQHESSFMPGRGEHISEPDPYQHHQPASSKFPGRQDFDFPQYPAQEMVQVQQVNQVPEPQFHAVPNTSIYSPQSMAPLPFSNYVQYDGHLPQEQAYATTMAPNQFFMPATEPGVADFQPPMSAAPQQIYREPAQNHPQYHHHQQPRQGLAQRHIAPMHYHGLPYAQASGWPQPQ